MLEPMMNNLLQPTWTCSHVDKIWNKNRTSKLPNVFLLELFVRILTKNEFSQEIGHKVRCVSRIACKSCVSIDSLDCVRKIHLICMLVHFNLIITLS